MTVTFPNLESLRDRIAEIMGWNHSDVGKFSLPTLASFVRGKDPRLDAELAETIRTGAHLIMEEPR